MTEPVLVMAFNRPDLLAQVLDRLRDVQPERVYVAVDGPRPDRPGEAERVQACRDLVGSIDWACEVRTLFQDRNLGCGLGVSTAITWFFEQEERGIILEDDIVPDPLVLRLLRGAARPVRGRRPGVRRSPAATSCLGRDWRSRAIAYRFSQVPHIWGWATWRRSWVQHRLHIKGWHRRLDPWTLLRRNGYSVPGAMFWASEFELPARDDVDTWDGSSPWPPWPAGS